ncbi:cap-specific mRNA (nucleoside-2'-O-)-methyltransferase 2 [Ixodes scapularis]|uniref:cap-specific mRNA (nucleoside-2'-O-)-methyltransferase 2 n=1 Tax=Ixodes scapularis TaxID=6945 RepID=UPI001A9DD077|nr:cap-specific mRNA (nucleoside-2'-O-)-methyltransferase 2 [Ixodes scapularis]
MSSAQDEVERVFKKVFAFQKSSAWQLPADPKRWCSEADVAWSLPDFKRLKTELNATKSLLNDMDPAAWRKHTTWTNRAGNVLNKVRKTAKPALLTQAWCKFYELLHEFQLADADPLRSFHLCEAPGAFVTALQHYLLSETGSKDTWTWYANSLNPYYEGNCSKSTVADDRLMFGTLERWYFGQDQTGDVMSPEFKIEEFLEGKEKFHLVTADGSVDCQDDPAEQESTVAALHGAEIAAAFKLLADGGHFVLKMFTFFESFSVSLLYLLNCLFEKVAVKKPACSKPGNSEVYVVCRGFQKHLITEVNLTVLTGESSATKKAAFCFKDVEDLPKDFLGQVDKCVRFFKDLQEEVINENIRWFRIDMNQEACSRLQHIKEAVAFTYVKKCRCRRVDDPTTALLFEDQTTVKSGGWNVASFAERSGRKDWWKDRISDLRKILAASSAPQDYLNGSSPFFRTATLDRTEASKASADWIQTGRNYGSFPGLSKFCSRHLLDLALMLGLQEQADWPKESDKIEPKMGKTDSADSVPDMDTTDKTSGLPQQKPPVIFLDSRDSKKAAESVLRELLQLEPGASLRLRFAETLGRFSVGLLYLVSSLFTTTTVTELSADSVARWPVWTLDGLLGEKADPVLKHLESIASMECKEDTIVLEVAPLRTLCWSGLGRFARSVNDAVVHRYASVVLDAAEKERSAKFVEEA